MTTTTAKGGFSLGDFIKRRAHEMVDARNASQEVEYRRRKAEMAAAEQEAWDGQVAGLAMQSAYANEMAVIRDEARLAGLLIQHASGFEVYTGILKNASNEQVRKWYHDHWGETSSDVMEAFKNANAKRQKERNRNEEVAKGSFFTGLKRKPVENEPEDDNDPAQYNGGKPLWT